MFRIAAIVILSAATVLTGVGWMCSYVEHVHLVPGRPTFRLTGSSAPDGWQYPGILAARPSSRMFASGCRGDFRCSWISNSAVLARLVPESCKIENATGLYFRAGPITSTGRMARLACPFWFPFVIFAAYPIYAIATRWVRPYRRRKAGQCVACGYPLIGNASGRCPECGQYPDHEDRNNVKGDQ
jgi:hypothetical protein